MFFFIKSMKKGNVVFRVNVGDIIYFNEFKVVVLFD